MFSVFLITKQKNQKKKFKKSILFFLTRKNQCSRHIVQNRSHMIHVHCMHVLWNHRVLLMYRHRMDILSKNSLGHGIQHHIYILVRVVRPKRCRIGHRYFGYQYSYHNHCHCLEQQTKQRRLHHQRCVRNRQQFVQWIGKYRVRYMHLGMNYVGTQNRQILLRKYIHHWSDHIYHVQHIRLCLKHDRFWQRQRQPMHQQLGMCLGEKKTKGEKKNI